MSTLTCTFRTFPFKDKIPRAFVFEKLNKDFITFSEKILRKKPEIIIGIAKSENSSRFEKLAINQFNKTKKVSLGGKNSFDLDLPENLIFPVSDKPTNSFCNWTAYKLKEFLDNNKLDIKLIFVHIGEKDINKLSSILFS